MGATGWLIRHRLRARWLALVPIAIVAALGATATFVAAGAADRTAHAYDRYLDRADVGDVVINPSLLTTDIDRVIRELPGVESVTTHAFFRATIDEDGPRPLAEVDGDDLGEIRGSVDGRFEVMDRPALREGRLPTGPNEALVGVEAAEDEDVEVGDVLPLSFWGRLDGLTAEPDTIVTPIGVEHVTVVGIATLPDEVLPDPAFPRRRMVVSSDIADRYDCLLELPPPDATLEEALAGQAPADCATQYQYYSLDLEDGASGVAAALEAFTAESEALTAELPEAIQEDGAAYLLIATTTADEQARVERSTQPLVVALGVLAGAAAAVTIIVLALAVARELRRAQADHLMWWRLGVARRQRLLVLVVPAALATGVGLAVAILGAWVLSPIAPVGAVRSIDPAPGRELSNWVGASALLLGAILVATIALLGVPTSARVGAIRVRPPTSLVRRLVRGSNRPEIDDGIRAAYGTSRGAGLIVATGGLAAAVFLAAVVFGTSLSAVVSTPASYGWPWDIGALGGGGYGGLDLDAIDATLAERDDVDSWTILGFSNSITLDGQAIVAILAFDESSEIDVAVVEGRLPTGDDEVALGARSADERGLGVGDEVEVAGFEIGESRRAEVSGIVVLPALGPFQADRAAPGRGVLVPNAMVDPSVAEAPGIGSLVSFVGIDTAPGADPRRVLADLRAPIATWDLYGDGVFQYDEPVRPAEIVNARSMRTAPMVVGSLLVASSMVGLSVAVVMSVRSRRRELAVLRALGFTGRQLRDSVRVQTVATIGGALVVGVPIGVALGRFAWRAFASQLGVVTEPSTPLWWVVATVVGAVVIALLAAAVPARVAARTEPAATLRSE